MGLISRLRGLFRGKDLAELQREGGWDVLGGSSTKGWTRADNIWHDYSQLDLENAYSVSAVIESCVKLKATVASEAWMQVGTWKDGAWESYDEHPFYDLIRRPNGAMDGREFIWNVVTHLELTGLSYITKIRDRGKQVIGLWPSPSSAVSEVYNKRGDLIYYRVSQGSGKALLVSPVDMFVIRYPNPSNPNAGLSPLQAALRDLQVDESRSNLLIEVLTNTHFASTIFQRPQMWADEEKKAIRAKFKDKIGPGKRGDALFVSGEGASVTFPSAPTDIDWPGTSSLSETRMCAVLGVPPILVGLRAGLERSTYANYELALKAFYRTTMKPLWNLLAGGLERGLFMDDGDMETEVEPFLDDIAELQEDLDSQHNRARADFHGGGITLNEYIEAIKKEPIGRDGELRVMPMNLVPFVAEGNMITEPKPESTPVPNEADEPSNGDNNDKHEPDDWEDGEPGEPDGDKSIRRANIQIKTTLGGNGKGQR